MEENIHLYKTIHMDREKFQPHQSTIARPDFNPFEEFESSSVKFVHISRQQIIELVGEINKNKLTDEDDVVLPQLDQEEYILWSPDTLKHSTSVTINFGIPYREVETKGKVINAGGADRYRIPGSDDAAPTYELLLLGTSGDLHNSEGQSLFSRHRTREGLEDKARLNERTNTLLKKIYGDAYAEYNHQEGKLS